MDHFSQPSFKADAVLSKEISNGWTTQTKTMTALGCHDMPPLDLPLSATGGGLAADAGDILVARLQQLKQQEMYTSCLIKQLETDPNRNKLLAPLFPPSRQIVILKKVLRDKSSRDISSAAMEKTSMIMTTVSVDSFSTSGNQSSGWPCPQSPSKTQVFKRHQSPKNATWIRPKSRQALQALWESLDGFENQKELFVRRLRK